MGKKMLEKAQRCLEGRRSRRLWLRVVTGLACAVVFCTVYALILPAIALEKPVCGIEEHVHTEECYVKADSLVCSPETLGLHVHTDSCYDDEGDITCGYADFVIHTHDSSCYGADGTLMCQLPEIGEHAHTEACYESGQSHTHTEDCYAVKRGALLCEKKESDSSESLEGSGGAEQGKLICGLEESDGHTHTEECGVKEEKTLICKEEESDGHRHTDACRDTERKLVCDLEESDGHAHTEDCYDDDGNLTCEQEEREGHRHDGDCYEEHSSLVCGLEESEGHRHGEECYEKISAADCGLEESEGHHHSDDCYESVSGTGPDTGEEHHHTDECYKTEKELICGQSGETEEAGERKLICDKEEIVPHEHTSDCYDGNGSFTCGRLQAAEHVHSGECFQEDTAGEDELTCKKPETEGHIHGEECYGEEGELICELEESPGHKHSTICYGNWKLVCRLEEHTHTEECYDLPLTEEEQEQVDEVIALIDELPDREEIEEKMAAFEEAEDEDGSDAYLTEIRRLAVEAYKKYSALTEAQKKKVTNAAKLMELEWLWGGQTLESNPLTEDKAYIGKLAMGTSSEDTSGGITDGSAPWDSTDDDGLDTNASNGRVRTFDTVTYDFYYTTALQDPQSTTSYDSAIVCFEFLLPAKKSQAVFSVDEMAWLEADGVSYVYEENLVTVNGVSYQVLHGSFLDERDGSEITAAARSRDVVIRVLNMKNNSTIQPVFTMWLGVNDVGVTCQNNIPQEIVYGSTYSCKTHSKNTEHNGHEWKTVIPDAVTVTCTPRYAVTLKRGEPSSTSWAGNFDFSTGNDNALDKADGTWNGRISAYGIRLMVQGLDKEHGLRGCAFPEPEDTLEFDITLVTAWQDSNGGDWQFITQEFTPKVWSAEEFSNAEMQKDGREVSVTKLPSYAAPLNQGEDSAQSCYNGGTWTFTDGEFKSEDSNHRVIHVTVSGYTFDPTHLPYTYERGKETDTEFYNPLEVGAQFWNIQNAVFSTGEIWVVTPFYNAPGTDSDRYITNVKNTSSLTMWQSIFAYDMEVKDSSNSSQYSKAGYLTHLDSSITLQNPGHFNAEVFAVKPINSWNTPLTAGCFEGENELKDYATPGSYVDLEAVLVHDEAEGDAVGVAYNLMVKFDNACFEPVTWAESSAGDGGDLNVGEFPYVGHAWTTWPDYTKSPDYQNGWGAHGPKMLYGTTKDGNGWNHGGRKPDQAGYDAEMMQAAPDDLVWYDSMEALKAAGAECVAVLMEYRNVGNDGNNPANSTMNHLHMTVHCKIKDMVEPEYVYAVANYAAVWTKADVQEYVTDVTGDGQFGTMDYLYYTQHDFPSYSPSATNKMNSATFPTPTHERSWKRCTNHGNGESGPDAVNGANGYGTATKSYLADDGTFMAGSGGYFFQDNVYVVGYKSEVGIQVAQTTDEGARSTYDMDANQRVADFKVTPRFVRSATDTGAGGTTTTIYTDATVTVILPQGLEYYPGTAFWGGSYAQDSDCQSPGTVTGGQALETQAVKNEDGTTTLTWVLKNVPLSAATEDLNPIYFSCRIGNSSDLTQDVTNNQEMKVQTDIYSTADPGAVHGAAHNNQASTSIRVSKSTNLTIIKTADKPIVDIGESMGFIMQLYNGSTTSYEGWVVDVLPYNGEGRSSFHGSLQVEEFKIIGSDISEQWKELTFYYTTDERYKGMLDATNLNVTGWSTFQLDNDYTWKPASQAAQITAIAYKCNIPGQGRIQMHITLSLPNSKPGDEIHNHLLLNNLRSNAYSQIVSRTLEGLTWMDDNGDGIQDEDAARRISGVKVELLKLKDNGDAAKESDYEPYCYPRTNKPIVIETGQQISVLASDSNSATIYEPGRYKFTDLPAGTFAVRFTDGDATKISPLLASPSNRGTDDMKDSDGIATYTVNHATLEKTVILGIDMPTAENMSVTLYESKCHDSGFYEKSHELPNTGGLGTTPYTMGGLLLLTGAGILLLYNSKKRRKEDFASS